MSQAPTPLGKTPQEKTPLNVPLCALFTGLAYLSYSLFYLKTPFDDPAYFMGPLLIGGIYGVLQGLYLDFMSAVLKVNRPVLLASISAPLALMAYFLLGGMVTDNTVAIDFNLLKNIVIFAGIGICGGIGFKLPTQI